MSSRVAISRKTSNRITRRSTSTTKAVNVKPVLTRGGIRF